MRLRRTYSLCRPEVSLPLLVGCLFLAAAPARAVIINGSAAGNTSAPTDPLLATRWDQVGNFDSFMGTPISPQFFLTAKHLGNLTGQSITFPDTSSYVTTAAFFDPNSDLAIYQISGTFPGDKIVPLYSGSFTTGQSIYVFGRGVPRTTTEVIGDAFPSGTEAKGWTWGSGIGTRSWGTNNFNSIADGGAAGPQISYDFDSTPANEGVLSIGDSGGPVFMQEGGIWKLAGINYAVESAFNTVSSGTGFNAAIYDRGGLYQSTSGSTSGPWTFISPTIANKPATSYSSSIPANSAWIATIVPEPGTISLITAAGLAAAIYTRRIRQRTTGGKSLGEGSLHGQPAAGLTPA
jgi:hypothetical protein